MVGLFYLETYFKNVSYIYMIVVTTDNNNNQFIKFIPRDSSVDTMYITDESTNIEVPVVIINYTPGDYTDEIEALFNLQEGHYYRLVLKDNAGDEIYRDRIFCTDQVPGDYTPNSQTYTANTTTNDFLMY
jgi:hypothetical protein